MLEREQDVGSAVEVAEDVGVLVDLHVVEVGSRGDSPEEHLALFVFPAVLPRGLLDFLDVLLPLVDDEGVGQQELGLLEQGGAVLVEDEEGSLLAVLVVALRDFLWNELIFKVENEVKVGQFGVVGNTFQISLVSDHSLMMFHIAIGVDLIIDYGEPGRLYFGFAAPFLYELGKL